MGKTRALKKKTSDAAPVEPPQLTRQISATSPLARHDNSSKQQAFTLDEKKWNDDCQSVFQEIGKASNQVSKSKLMQLYSSFASPLPDTPNEDGVFGEGLVEFFEALSIDPATDLVALLFAQRCQAKQMGIFDRLEFIRGLAKLDVSSLDGLGSKIPELRSHLARPQELRALYMYTFDIALQPPRKTLSFEDACQLWPLFLGECPHLKDWCAWVIETQTKECSKDLWDMFWLFATEVGADLATYDDSSDWPVTLDNFVEHLRKRRGK